VRDFEQRFYRFLESEREDLLKTLGDKKELTDEVVNGLKEATEAFKETFVS
jgi:F0F1-type ATP synthase alpha subunit